ncbi:ferritin-like domain-containing protein [Lutispora saccharofermentans]|uniref:Ferritin-like domain-containing protein n=1 Tax=Lutispora saccharofermentans TaxID=3024236 RepID=A0ABT1NA68_9FIRM|nr:ferritin-like domain-containing protein [Lutispora saccharofermentans]MCQ1528152.1 ferritin-like domain-containing protein [Lutispora saccharofermentans]
MDNYDDNSKLLDLLREAMKDERHDYLKYKMMMEAAPSREIADQVRFAHEDEGKHYRMFQKIYKDLTGRTIEIPIPQVEKYENYIDAVKSSINGELEAVELYRDIRSMLNSKKHRDMLFEIITDEQEHATRFVYVFSMLK